METENDKLY